MSAIGAARAERKLMAVLAADVVGYSRLMGEDEEGTLAALKAVRGEVTDPKIEEHRGRIVKTLGDGLLVEFASVVDAVRCAVDVQRLMSVRGREDRSGRRIEFRIGINLGDVIVDGEDIFGDGVNVAARLEGLAEPGGICVSRVVRDQVRDKLGFGFEDLGQREVKNIARPVHIFRVSIDAGPGAGLELPDRMASGTVAPPHMAIVPAAGGQLPDNLRPPSSNSAGLRKIAVVAALVAFAAIGVAGGLWTWTGGMNAAPGPNPSPTIGGPVLFERDQVVMIPSANETVAQQAKFLHDNPDIDVVIAASCARDEGGRTGALVLAQLRANQVRDALEKHGIAGARMTTENVCDVGAQKKLSREVSEARDGQVFVLWK